MYSDINTLGTARTTHNLRFPAGRIRLTHRHRSISCDGAGTLSRYTPYYPGFKIIMFNSKYLKSAIAPAIWLMILSPAFGFLRILMREESGLFVNLLDFPYEIINLSECKWD